MAGDEELKTSSSSSRRVFLGRAGVAASALVGVFATQPLEAVGGKTSRQPGSAGGERGSEHLVAGIDPKNVVNEFASRKIDELSDSGMLRYGCIRSWAEATLSCCCRSPLRFMDQGKST